MSSSSFSLHSEPSRYQYSTTGYDDESGSSSSSSFHRPRASHVSGFTAERTRVNKRKDREGEMRDGGLVDDDDDDESMEQKEYDRPSYQSDPRYNNNSKSQARKHVRQPDQANSSNFFAALVDWAKDPNGWKVWQEENEQFNFCVHHSRVFDLHSKRTSNDCQECQETADTKKLSQEEFHANQYPMTVKYYPQDKDGCRIITADYRKSFDFIEQLKKELEELRSEISADKAAEDPRIVKLADGLEIADQTHHAIYATYVQYAWLVASEIRKEWNKDQPNIPPYLSEFLNTFNEQMLMSQTGAGGRMWCRKHSNLGYWNMMDLDAKSFLDCGLCRKPRAPKAFEVDYEQRSFERPNFNAPDSEMAQ